MQIYPLDGKIQLSAFVADDHDPDILTFRQVLADVTDIGVCYFGDMYQTCLIVRQTDKCAEIGDRFYFSF